MLADGGSYPGSILVAITWTPAAGGGSAGRRDRRSRHHRANRPSRRQWHTPGRLAAGEPMLTHVRSQPHSHTVPAGNSHGVGGIPYR